MNSSGDFADVQKVQASGQSGNYQFTVTLASPDTGCDQYADWWEILSEEGVLLYRRVLLHSHVNEQPFSRSGGPVKIASDEKIWIRAHMNNTGYGGKVMYGSPDDGFEVHNIPEGFASEVEKQEPLPEGCMF